MSIVETRDRTHASCVTKRFEVGRHCGIIDIGRRVPQNPSPSENNPPVTGAPRCLLLDSLCATIENKVLDDVVYDDEYVDRMDRIVNTGKYGVVECIERLWFMKGMSIRKRRKNDEFVEIYEAGKWETRVFADVFPNMMKKIERYHDPYFDRIRANWSGLTPRAKQKRLYVLRCYGHAMLWYGWTCQSIEKIGTYLNEPDDEPERKRRVRVMSKLFMEKIYQLSRSMRAL